MNEATNGFSRVVEYKGCAIDPVSTAGSWAPRWTREGKRYDRLPAFATRTKAIEQTGVSPTKVRKVPQDFCQQSGRKGFSANPELP